MSGVDLICCVVNNGDASKIMKVARKYGVQGMSVSIGRGTINNRLLEFLQLNESRKEYVSMIVESTKTAETIQGISKDMGFAKPNHGIAFSHSVSEVVVRGKKRVCKQEDNTQAREVKKTMYNAIHVVVEKGRAEDVVAVATKAGARGGTILNARGAGSEEAQKFFSLEIEPEKEKVFIITKAELKDAIVDAITKHLEVEEAGNGIVYVLDVNEAYGLQ
jgi:Nitrogen regulatory protein PII